MKNVYQYQAYLCKVDLIGGPECITLTTSVQLFDHFIVSLTGLLFSCVCCLAMKYLCDQVVTKRKFRRVNLNGNYAK